MLTRLALILSLVWQPLAVSASYVRTAEAGGSCVVDPCCELVTRTTCCGLTVVESECSNSAGGSCPCGVEGSDERAPQREAPGTIVPHDRLVAAGGRTARVIRATGGAVRPSGSGASFSVLCTNRTNNGVRAFLSNWRT